MPKVRLNVNIGERTSKGTKVTVKQYIGAMRDASTYIQINADNTEKIANAINQGIAAALEEIGQVAEGDAAKLCPVDTGRLRASITHAITELGADGGEVIIGTNVEYATYVHEGTKKMAGNPFLRNAVNGKKPKYERIVRKHLGG